MLPQPISVGEERCNACLRSSGVCRRAPVLCKEIVGEDCRSGWVLGYLLDAPLL